MRTPGGERSITLREGEIRGASSDDPADRHGEHLVRLGYVERAKLEEVLRVGDRVAVLRDGRIVDTMRSTDLTVDSVLALVAQPDLLED